MQVEEDVALPGPSTVSSTEPKRRKGLFKGIAELPIAESTPRKKFLMQVVLNKEDQIRKLKRMCKDRAKYIKELSDLTDETVVRRLFHGMPETTADFLLSQIRCAVKTPRARRWTIEEKILALSMMKRGPRAYRFMQMFVALPSRRTLLDLLKQIPFSSGINKNLFMHINDTFARRVDRLCIITFDEMDIKENLFYDKSADRIFGLEDFGDGKISTKHATKALVFMCQGIARNWKQPVAYYFSHNATTSENLIECLTEVIRAARHVGGLDVVATICDMGSNNVKALKTLRSSVEEPFIVVDNQRVFTMFDPCHLLKCLVALFRKYNVSFPHSTVQGETQIVEAKFDDIVKAHEIDKANSAEVCLRVMRRITSHHLAPVMKFAMKVCIAAQVMSSTVAACLNSFIASGVIEQRCFATSLFVMNVDKLFDSFNGSQENPGANPLRCAVTPRSAHSRFWRTAFGMVRQWTFKRITKKGQQKQGKPPSQIGWLTTIKAIRRIWRYVRTKGLKVLKPRYLNQDPLENLFGAVRAGCGSSDNPTAYQFVGSLKSQICQGLTGSALSGTNCEKDEHKLLSNLRTFITGIDETEGDLGVAPLAEMEPFPETSDEDPDATIFEGTKVMSVAYVSGFIARRLLNNHACQECKILLTSHPSEPHNLFISFKEFSEDARQLFYPSEQLVKFVGHAITVLEQFIPTFGGQSGIAKAATAKIKERVDATWFTCQTHHDRIMESAAVAVCAIGLPWWAKRQNREILDTKKNTRETKRKLAKLKHGK